MQKQTNKQEKNKTKQNKESKTKLVLKCVYTCSFPSCYHHISVVILLSSTGLKDTAEELVKKKMEAKTELTPWEKDLEKKKEKSRKKRDEKKQVGIFYPSFI